MENRLNTTTIVLGWIAKCVIALVPASVLPRIWTAHPHMSFGLGLSIGIVLQHFVPPRGTLFRLIILLAVAIVATYVAAHL
jgi:ABC-type multidrug transport system permease subunit